MAFIARAAAFAFMAFVAGAAAFAFMALFAGAAAGAAPLELQPLLFLPGYLKSKPAINKPQIC